VFDRIRDEEIAAAKYQHAVNHGIIYGFGWRPSKTSFFRRSSLVFCEKFGYRLWERNSSYHSET